MNIKKGFTLVELLAVVIILTILIAMIAPNLVKLTKDKKQQVYNSKIEWIESNATLWGTAHLDSLNKQCTCVTIQTLVDETYLSGENLERNIIYDPRNNTSINDYNVCIKYDDATDVVSATVLKPTDDNSVCD